MSLRLKLLLLAATGTLALPGALLTSCSLLPGRRPSAPAPEPLVETESRVGTVRAIGAGQRFVLIETPSALAASALREGQVLHCRSADGAFAAGAPSADLRVSRERHETLVVANVIAGEPAIGAVVSSVPPGAPTASIPMLPPLPGLPHP